MNTINTFSTTAVIFLAALSTCEAAIISADDPVFGAGSLTRDTVQQLDFLDPTLSTNRSWNDVAGEFGPGGDFEGFRHATDAEVQALVINWGFSPLPLLGVLNIGDTGADQISGLVDLLGHTVIVGSGTSGSENVTAFTGTLFAPGAVHVASLEDFIHEFDNDRVRFDPVLSANVISPNVGHFLVRPVPEPSSLALLGMGGLTLFGCGWRRRRKTELSA